MLNESTEYIHVYFNMLKYQNMVFKNQSKMAAVKWQIIFLIFFKIVLFCTKTPVSGIIWFRGIDYFLICQEINHYGRFQNGRR